MAEKFCIFCGKKPEHKNMEHVIPQWLIKMTGRENKDVFENFPASHKHLPFMQFKFPACEKCNSQYSNLEAKVRPIMADLLEDKPISGAQADLLLDWFDKVRIGLWLVEMCYDPELKKHVQPNFYIDSRIAKADRVLSIKKINMKPGEQGIYFAGTQSPLFHYFPSAFALMINDHYFTNISNISLVAPRVGFPYLQNAQTICPFSPEMLCSLKPGRHKVTNPIVKEFIPNPDSITFYQPIVRDANANSWILNDEYALNHCYDAAEGRGGIFVQKGNIGNIRYLEKTDRVGTKLKAVPATDFVVDTLKLQSNIHKISITKSTASSYQAIQNDKIVQALTKSH